MPVPPVKNNMLPPDIYPKFNPLPRALLSFILLPCMPPKNYLVNAPLSYFLISRGIDVHYFTLICPSNLRSVSISSPELIELNSDCDFCNSSNDFPKINPINLILD